MVFNIFQAHVKPGKPGDMIIEVTGERENIEAGIRFLKDGGIDVDILTSCIIWDEDMCVHCGACTAVCASGALYLDEDAKLVFDDSKCIACEMCISACPSSVLRVNFTNSDD